MFHAIIRSVRDYAIFMTDLEGRILSWNQGVEQLLGYPEAEFINQPVSFIFTIEDNACGAHLLDMERAKIEGRGQSRRAYVRRDGGRIWASGLVMPLTDEAGELRGFAKVMHDDTANKQAEEALQESRAMLQLIMDSIPQRIYWKDLNLVYLGCNRTFAKVSGFDSAEQIVGKSDYDLLPKTEEADFFRECDWRAIETRMPEFHVIEPRLQVDGKEVWLDTNRVPLQDAEGNVIGVLCTYEDITAHKQAEEELEALNRHVTNILESITDAFLAVDHQWRLTYMNRQAVRLLQRTREEMIGRRLWEEFPEAVGSFFHAQLTRALVEQVAVKCEDFYPPLNMWLEVHASPSQDGLSIYFQDTSERKWEQDKMRTSEVRYRRLFESARDGVLILDKETRKITDVNPYMVEFLGFTHDEFLGKELWEIGLMKDAEASSMAFQELQQEGYIRYEDLPLQTKDGELREVEFISNVYEEGGHNVIQCNIRDITERRHAEAMALESVERYRQVVELSPDPIFIVTRDAIVFANASMLRILEADDFAQIVGHSPLEFIHVDSRPIVEAQIKQMLETGESTPLAYQRWLRRDGSVIDVESIAAPIEWQSTTGIQVILRDITERKAAEDNIKHAAFHDALTGLPNRLLFTEHLKRAIAHAERHEDYLFGVLFLDLDGFKVINDSLGHVIADQLLVSTAHKLAAVMRPEDIVA
ncbi:MAG: PAS domain S-box protein, partial [Acidobacteriota bacterium]|nr:PAS domain S-box protein [Acidobacteriota bacterium]